MKHAIPAHITTPRQRIYSFCKHNHHYQSLYYVKKPKYEHDRLCATKDETINIGITCTWSVYSRWTTNNQIEDHDIDLKARPSPTKRCNHPSVSHVLLLSKCFSPIHRLICLRTWWSHTERRPWRRKTGSAVHNEQSLKWPTWTRLTNRLELEIRLSTGTKMPQKETKNSSNRSGARK